jgi:hypothetical protein
VTTYNCNLLLDYFNQALEEKECEQFEEHLAACNGCQEELNELTDLTKDLPYLSAPVNPPIGMKDRILTNVFNEETTIKPVDVKNEVPPTPFIRKEKRSKNAWSMIALAAALLLSLVGNVYSFTNTNESAEKAPNVSLDKLVKEVQLQPTKEGALAATASLVEKSGVLNVIVKADGLAGVKENQVYQVWLLENGQPYRAGSFVPNKDGSGMVTYQVDGMEGHNWDTVAITLEPDINSETPLGEIILASEL